MSSLFLAEKNPSVTPLRQTMSLPGESKVCVLCFDPLGNYERQVLESELLQFKTWGISIDLDLQCHFKNEVNVAGVLVSWQTLLP